MGGAYGCGQLRVGRGDADGWWLVVVGVWLRVGGTWKAECDGGGVGVVGVMVVVDDGDCSEGSAVSMGLY